MSRVEVQYIDQTNYSPSLEQFQYWVKLVLSDSEQNKDVLIRIVDSSEGALLNEQYRKKLGPTNILSFPVEAPFGVEHNLLGDLVICASKVNQEADLQNKKINDHWAHIVIHGLLHLLGYDHINDIDAERMETREIELLKSMNINNPYQEVMDNEG